MISLLLSMMILSLFFPMTLTLTQHLISIERFPHEVQDQIALVQLRRFLNGCLIEEVHSNQLVCQNEKEWKLQCSQNHLYLSDGTIIVLEGVDEVYFETRDNEVWMLYQRNTKWKEVLIAGV